jgi:hypothetical protein
MKYFASLVRQQFGEDAGRPEFWVTIVFRVTTAVLDHQTYWVRSLRDEFATSRHISTLALIAVVFSAPFFVPLLVESLVDSVVGSLFADGLGAPACVAHRRKRVATWWQSKVFWARFSVYPAFICIQNLAVPGRVHERIFQWYVSIRSCTFPNRWPKRWHPLLAVMSWEHLRSEPATCLVGSRSTSPLR